MRIQPVFNLALSASPFLSSSTPPSYGTYGSSGTMGFDYPPLPGPGASVPGDEFFKSHGFEDWILTTSHALPETKDSILITQPPHGSLEHRGVSSAPQVLLAKAGGLRVELRAPNGIHRPMYNFDICSFRVEGFKIMATKKGKFGLSNIQYKIVGSDREEGEVVATKGSGWFSGPVTFSERELSVAGLKELQWVEITATEKGKEVEFTLDDLKLNKKCRMY